MPFDGGTKVYPFTAIMVMQIKNYFRSPERQDTKEDRPEERQDTETWDGTEAGKKSRNGDRSPALGGR